MPRGDGSLQVLGGDEQTLRGGSIDWLSRHLIPLLDGSRTIDTIAALLPTVGRSDLADLMQLLHMHGMLEEGPNASDAVDFSNASTARQSQLSFFSRYLRMTGLSSSRYDVQRRLSSSVFGVIGDVDRARLLLDFLSDAGAACEFVLDPKVPTARHAYTLLIVLGDARCHRRAAEEWCTAGQACLFVNPERLEIGPLTVPGDSACPVCSQSQRDFGDETGVRAPLPGLWERALVSRVVQNVVAFATGLCPPRALTAVESWQPMAEAHYGPGSFEDEVVRLPSCPLCGTGAARSSGQVIGREERPGELAFLFHTTAMLKPWHMDQPAAIQMHLSPAVARLQNNAEIEKDPPAVGPDFDNQLTRGNGAPAVPPRDVMRNSTMTAQSWTDGTEPAAWLSAMLRLSFGGIRTVLDNGHYYFVRNTASAGNLGSAEAFVAVESVAGLRSGLYQYSFSRDRLEELDRERMPGEWASCFPGDDKGRHARASATIVIVSAVGRLCTKYHGRGYTYALIDAGLMIRRLTALAKSVGSSVEVDWNIDAIAISQLLGIDGVDLAPTAAIFLGRV